MLATEQQWLSLVRKFITTCDRADIWYALDRRTLRQSQQLASFGSNPKRFEVMMSLGSYKKLEQLCAQNIVDSFLDRTYKPLSPLFVVNKADWKSSQPVVSIRLLVPTTVQRLRRFLSWASAVKNMLKWRPRNVKTAVNDLIERSHYQGYYLLESKHHFARQNWIQALSFRRVEISVGGLKVKIIREFDAVLKYWYGLKYAKPSGLRM